MGTPSPVMSQPRSLGVEEVEVMAGPAPGGSTSITSAESMDPRLRPVSKLGELTLCHEWVADSNDCGSYRFLHYSAYDYKHTKILEGETETVLSGGVNCGCGCCPAAIRIRIRDLQGCEVIAIQLTDSVGRNPIDTAEIYGPEGIIMAYVVWRRKTSSFEVSDPSNTPMLRLKMARCYMCSGTRENLIYAGESNHVLGKITVEFPNIMALVNGREKLTTEVPRELTVRQKVSWVALLFLTKLVFNGKEYSKIVRI